MSARRVDGLQGFIDRYGSEAPEVIWTAALAWLERAAGDARNVASGRWRYYPRGEVRRLRDEIAGALMLARLAAALQEEENSRERQLVHELQDANEQQRRARKRAGTRAAERARLERPRRVGGGL